METTINWPLAFFMATLFAIACSYISINKKKSPYLWFALGFFFGILALLAIFILPKKEIIITAEPNSKANSIPAKPHKLWYYLDHGDQQFGPMSYGAIEKALEEKKIDPHTYVWNEDLHDWKRLKEFLPASLNDTRNKAT